jgi:hypothetical protein
MSGINKGDAGRNRCVQQTFRSDFLPIASEEDAEGLGRATL